MPSTKRPPVSACTLAAAVAATAGWRVAVFVTAVASFSVDVAAPASGGGDVRIAGQALRVDDAHARPALGLDPPGSGAAAPGTPMPGVHISTVVMAGHPRDPPGRRHQSNAARPVWMSISAARSSAVRGERPAVPTGQPLAVDDERADRRDDGRRAGERQLGVGRAIHSTHSPTVDLALLDRPATVAGQAQQRVAGHAVQVGIGEGRREQLPTVDQHDVRRAGLLEATARARTAPGRRRSARWASMIGASAIA